VPALAAAASSCAWDPWIPGQRSWNPDVVADPSQLAEQLPLDTRHVDELDCYAQRCQKRFRVVLEEPGQLTVSAIPELASQDDQARIVLEAVQGVLGQASSGRGPREDVTVLAVRERVDAGTYWVLVQSLGGPMPYQITASLTPGEGPAPAPTPEPVVKPGTGPVEGPPPRFAKVDLPGNADAGYDPAVSFDALRTFTFPAPVRPGEGVPAGTPLEQPIDRQIRRLLADQLTLKGFRQASGGEAADFLVDFSRDETTRSYLPLPIIYSWYDWNAIDMAYPLTSRQEVVTRGTLVVDLIDLHSNRIAWHARATKGLGPGITYGEATTTRLREAVADLLAPFPPF
jgi:hypothetical protein